MKDETEASHLKNISKALVFLADEFNKLKVNWLLGASGALLVWGIKIVPKDLDIFVSGDDVIKLSEFFKEYLTEPICQFERSNRKYLKFKMKIFEVEIEICELDFRNEKIVSVDFASRKIPVNPLEKELEFYEKREGKEKIVELIKKRLHL